MCTRKGWNFTWHVQRSLTYITWLYIVGLYALIELKCSYTLADNECKYSDMPAYTFTPTLFSRRRGIHFCVIYQLYIWGLQWTNVLENKHMQKENCLKNEIKFDWCLWFISSIIGNWRSKYENFILKFAKLLNFPNFE